MSFDLEQKIVIVGAGNLATRLGIEFMKRGCRIVQVYSRSEGSARALAERLGVSFTTDLQKLYKGADLYIFSLSDDALPKVLSQIEYTGGLWVHTAGCVDMDVFKGFVPRFGVFYPLQTFSKSRSIDFSKVAIFIEANHRSDFVFLNELGSLLSDRVIFLPSKQRRFLHLAAVFACNFTNHFYTIAFKLLEDHGIDSSVLLPLTEETEAKIHELPPFSAQTGPALRLDSGVMAKHIELLEEEDLRLLYRMISEHIHKLHSIS